MKYLIIFLILILAIAYYVVERSFKSILFIILYLWHFKVTKDMKSMIIEVDVFVPVGKGVLFIYPDTISYFSECFKIRL